MNKIDRIIELLESIDSKLGTKQKRKTKTIGENDDSFWPTYCESFRAKYKVEPERNAMINGMISSIKKRVSSDDLQNLIVFFLQQNDSWYLREMHHVRCLVKDCELLLTRMKSKVFISKSKANEIERQSDNLNESQRFLQNKYRNERNPK